MAETAFSLIMNSGSYEAASNSMSYLKFEIPTRKLFFKSHVTGYARKFIAMGLIKEGKFESGDVQFEVRDLDTDLYARNDQMWNYCLGYKEHPKVEIHLHDYPFTPEREFEATASIAIRGKVKELPLKLKISKDGKTVDGEAHTSFEALGIPDPSIGIAAVSGPIDIFWHLEDAPKAVLIK